MNNTPLEQRALEFWATEYEADAWKRKANDIRNGNLTPDDQRAIRAISRALGDRTERERVIQFAWSQKPGCGFTEEELCALRRFADSIASGAHLKERG